MIKGMLRRIRSEFRKFNKQMKLKMAPRITKDRIKLGLLELGVNKGDVLFVHSSMRSMGFVEGGAETVLKALMEVVSISGTVVIPTYHTVGGTMYETCLSKDYIFDSSVAPTHLGAIPAIALKIEGIKRSIHPTHSVSAVGKDAEYITEAHHLADSTFGKNSPWDRFVKLNGKVLGLGVSMGPVTFYHMVEDMMMDEFPLPVRMSKTYFLKCRDWQGNLINVPVNPLDPAYAKKRIDQADREDLRNYFWNEFRKNNLLKVEKVGRSTSWLISSQIFYSHLVELAKKGITIYSSPGDLER